MSGLVEPKKPRISITTNDRSGLREVRDALFNPQALINDWNAGNKAKFDALMRNEAAAGVLGPGVENLAAMQTAAMQARASGETKAGNLGNALGLLTEGLVEDEDGNIGGAGRLGVYAAKNAGDIAGGVLRAGGWAAKADEAANMAGAMAEAQNSHARAALMGQAGEAADAMNLRNMARTGEMTDAAVANAGAFESGMQGIDMSGIEGSENMERNLQYGKSRSEAQADLQYEMMNQEARGLENSMARSFSDLSQGKAGAMRDAWGQSIGRSQADLTALYQDTAAQQMALQPTANDEAALLAEAAKAAAANPNLPGEVPEPAGEAPEPAGEAPTAASNAGAAAEGPDAYEQLVGYLGEKRSEKDLTNEMNKLGIGSEYHKAIQDNTIAGTDDWREELFTVMRGQGLTKRAKALKRGEM
jgi:hypothetical protein